MRPRTRRLKSLLVGMVRSFGQATGDTPPSDYARGDPKAGTADPGVCPLCLTGALAGAGPMRLGADRAPGSIVHRGGGGGKRRPVSVIVSRSEDTLRPAVSEYVRLVNVIAGFVV